MKGFSDTALILLPDYQKSHDRGDKYIYEISQCIENLVIYLGLRDIDAIGLYTDDLMRELRPSGVDLINTLSVSDSFWVSKHCEGMQDALTVKKWDRQDLITKNTTEKEDLNDLSEEERFNLVLKHDKKVTSLFIANQKIVFVFKYGESSKGYKVTSKPNDQRIRVFIDAATYVPRVFMGGEEMAANVVLQMPSATRSILKWEL